MDLYCALSWLGRMSKKIEDCLGGFMVACLFKNVVDGYQWVFTMVYGPNLNRTKSLLCDELAGLSNTWDLCWCIGGDVNVTRFLSERSSGSSFNLAMVDFSNFISKQDLLHIPLANGSFTWSCNREHPSWSRIDVFPLSLEWEAHYHDLVQKKLPRFCSHHFPILIDCGGLHGGPICF
ncbi:hypothetical protein I3842_05G000600 [Carya illinoinensis]|nr:hypothetical protein I3842_05G000600 [Carya illinoinensis]